MLEEGLKIKALILAAGYATRLYPLTKDKPKPLLPIAGKPIIEHIIYRIDELEAVDTIYVVTNDKFYNNFIDWRKGFEGKKEIKIINDNTKSNEDRLGAVGDMHFVISKEKVDDDLLVIAGDNLFEFSLRDMCSLFNEKSSTVVAFRDLGDKSLIANKLGTAHLDEAGKILEFKEKPPEPKSSLAATACYLFTKDDLVELERCIKQNKKPDNSGDFVRHLSERKHVYAFVFEEKWFDIGSHEQLKEAHEYFSRNN